MASASICTCDTPVNEQRYHSDSERERQPVAASGEGEQARPESPTPQQLTLTVTPPIGDNYMRKTVPFIGALALVAASTFLSAGTAGASPAGVVDLPVSFAVKNTNNSLVPCPS